MIPARNPLFGFDGLPSPGTLWSGSAFLGADTFLGPAYLGLGVGASGQTTSPLKVTEQARAAGLTANDVRGLLYDRDTVAFLTNNAQVFDIALWHRSTGTLEHFDKWGPEVNAKVKTEGFAIFVTGFAVFCYRCVGDTQAFLV